MEWIRITDLRGGRNGVASPISPDFPLNQVVEAVNIEYSQNAQLGRKRAGMSSLSLSGGTAPVGGVFWLYRHVPGADEAVAELWAGDGGSGGPPVIHRLAGGTTWADVTLDDAMTNASVVKISAVTFNGKLYMTYDSAVDRLHVYDSTLASPRVRRVGFATPAIATVANTGAGAYAAVARYYRIRWYQASSASGGTITRISEPGPASTIFTPSGAGTAARITRPTAAGEGETHWGVEVSLDGVLWYVLAAPNDDVLSADGIAIATTTYDDSVVTTTYSTYPLSEELGTHTNIASVRFLITDNNRLIMAGSFEGGPSSRVYYTPVLGSGLGDAERLNDLVDINPFTDLNEKDGGAITGLGGPLPGGVIFAFKLRQIWRGTPTGNDEEPYAWRRFSSVIGSVNHRSIVLGEDHYGKAALYFWSINGPYRIGNNGLEYVGRDIEDITLGYNGFTGINYIGSGPDHVCNAVWHADKHMLYFFVASLTAAFPDIMLTLDVRNVIGVDAYGVRGGWVRHTVGNPTYGMNASAMFSNTIGASVMSAALKPYVGRGSVALPTQILKLDDDSATDDATVAFGGYFKTRNIAPPENLGSNFGVRETVLFAKALAACTITQTIVRDSGLETQDSSVLLTADASETDVIRKFEGSSNSDIGVIQLQIGDATTGNTRWELNSLLVPVTTERTK
jgi:hypothetical protein